LERANLSDAQLAGADLRGSNLRRVNLRRADLREANLARCDLRGANLTEAILAGASFSHANLENAVLRFALAGGARLDSANLSGADLTVANFVLANLGGADLDSALLAETIFGDTNLARVTGLESVHHNGASVIDERTLRRSWPLPEGFLRGCGLSEPLITYLPSLLERPIDFYSCFISYSRKDQGFADRLNAGLQAQGVRCWFDRKDMKIGDPIRDVIDQAIRLHDKLLLILSEHSVQSNWVASEVEAALERERRQNRRVLFPLRIDDAVMRTRTAWAAEIRRTRHIGDFRRWNDHVAYQAAFKRLLRDLKASDKGAPES
jgi:hypothetical protein